MIQLSILKFLKNNKVNNIYIKDEKDNSLDKRKTLYQQILGCIGYLATTIRPDVAYAASALGQVSANPNKTHITYVRRTLGYLNRTAAYSIRYTFDSQSSNNNALLAYVDHVPLGRKNDENYKCLIIFDKALLYVILI